MASGEGRGDTRCDAETNIVELTQLLWRFVDLLKVRSPRVENGLWVVKTKLSTSLEDRDGRRERVADITTRDFATNLHTTC